MKASHVIAFLGGATVATLITLLFTTEKGSEFMKQVSDKFTKEELDKLLNALVKEKNKLEALENEVDNEIKEIKHELKKK